MVFKRATIDESVWFDDNLEAHYWAGLIAADGCLFVKKGKYRNYNQICVYLSGEDGLHVQELFNFMKSSYKIAKRDISDRKWVNKTTYQMGGVFWSDQGWNWLQGHGITERKSLTLKVSSLLADSPDFWRGVIDGDGTVNFAKNRGINYPHIGLGGSEDLMIQFQSFVSKHLGVTPKVGTCRSIYRIAMNGQPAQDLTRFLYNRPGPALPRKKAAAMACIDWKGKHSSRQRQTLLTPSYAASANSTAKSSAWRLRVAAEPNQADVNRLS